MGPSFHLVQDNAWPLAAKVCRHFLGDEGTDAADWTSHLPDLKSNLTPKGHSVSVHPKTPCATTDCAGAQWRPNPRLEADFPGHHPLSHQEHTKTLSRVHTGAIQTTESLWVALLKFIQVGKACDFFLFNVIYKVILNPALTGLILVSTECCNDIFFSKKLYYINQ